MELLVDFNATHGRGVFWTVINEGDVMVGQQVIASDPDEDLRFYGVIADLRPAKAVGRTVAVIRVGPEWISA